MAVVKMPSVAVATAAVVGFTIIAVTAAGGGDIMSSYWANFAASGDPNGKGLPHWPSIQEQPDATMNLGDRFAPIPVAGSVDKLHLLRELLIPKPRT